MIGNILVIDLCLCHESRMLSLYERSIQVARGFATPLRKESFAKLSVAPEAPQAQVPRFSKLAPPMFLPLFYPTYNEVFGEISEPN